jgi:murein L,D-transpeptidase YcbB/YkuD
LIAALVAASAASQQTERIGLAPAAVARFYETRSGVAAWSDDDRFDGLIGAIERLSEHGLDPAHYHLAALRANRDAPERREILATDAWFAAAAHMVYGKLDPSTYEPDWTAARRQRDFVKHLNIVLANESVEGSLDALAPRYPEYAALKDELARLSRGQDAPIAVVADGPVMRLGLSGARVSALKQRLMQLGLIGEHARADLFDDATEEAVRHFQDASGLDADGVVGPVTLAALNRSARDKIRQIRVNLERWRWLPDELGGRHVRVNIADFSTAVYSEGRLARTHLSIVGKRYRKTPVFSDEIEYVVLNPWWETPSSIARKDKLPLFQQDPAAVDRLGFQILDRDGRLVQSSALDWSSFSAGNFPYRIRQAPGPLNALGRIKIMFPNKHNVYLHDTPSRGLFAERQRAFSSGCIRVQDPVDLAAWLFEGSQDWNKPRFDAVIAGGEVTRINLPSPIPVHVLYFTVVVDSSGTLRYLDDLYARDDLVFRALIEPSLRS